ncbi:hypothetical protein [Nocardia australiensis]|nr:hypothetical protein [Nocardia australiensis]
MDRSTIPVEAWRDRGPQACDTSRRIGLVGDEMQHTEQQHRARLLESE